MTITNERIGELRFGIERIIEKAKYDEYGEFEDVRRRIVDLCQDILTEDDRRAAYQTASEQRGKQQCGYRK